MMSMLPKDLLVEVLTRLPVQSLIKFRCVSKSWKTLIDSKEFINSQLSHSSKCPKFIVGARSFLPPGEDNETNLYTKFYAADLDSPGKMRRTMAELHSPFQNYPNLSYNIVGSCNGLLCLTPMKFNVVLLNPCTNSAWELPSSRTISHTLGRRKKLLYHNVLISYGFGYDDTRDDYKVVRLIELGCDINFKPVEEVKIYSLKSDCWRQLPPFPYFVTQGDRGYLANSALHWIMFDENRSRFVIGAVDVRTEKYHLVPFPTEIPIEKRCGRLGVLEGCLTIIYSHTYPLIDLWIMKDYGVKDSWTKVVLELPNFTGDAESRIRWLHPDLKPLGYSHGGRKIVFQNDDKNVMWYDNEDKLVETESLVDSFSSMFMRYKFHFIASLVDPCGGKDRSIFRHSRQYLPGKRSMYRRRYSTQGRNYGKRLRI